MSERGEAVECPVCGEKAQALADVVLKEDRAKLALWGGDDCGPQVLLLCG